MWILMAAIVLTAGVNTVSIDDVTGAATVALNGSTVLSGTLVAENSSARFSITGETAFGSLRYTAITAQGVNAMRVWRLYAKAYVKMVYALSGEDLTITATVTNRATTPISVLGFTGLVGSWTYNQASGLLGATGWDDTTFAANTIAFFHPSSAIPIGAAYRIPTGDAAFGVCAHPVNTGLTRTLVHWYNKQDGLGGVTPGLELFVAPATFRFPGAPGANVGSIETAPVASSGIHPGESYTVAWGIRVSGDVTATHLLGAYKTQFNAAFGPCVYAAARDDRPITVSFPGADDAAVNEGNPYGYLGGLNRLDLGVTDWLTAYKDLMVAAGSQGVIFWTLNGYDTRFPGVPGGGINYNTDIHILPPETYANLPELKSALTAAGLKLGRESRTGVVRSRGTWAADYTYPVDGTSAWQLADLIARFAIATADGIQFYYCDTFPITFADHLTLKALRGAWGPTAPLTYTEFFTDVSCVYSGVYTEVTGPPYTSGGVDPASGINMLELARWITPSTSVMAANLTGAWGTDVLDYLYQHQLSPRVDTLTLATESGLPETLAGYNGTYLTANQFANS